VLHLRGSDRDDATKTPQARVALTLIGADEAELRKIYDDLSAGGTQENQSKRRSGETSSAHSPTGSASTGRSTLEAHSPNESSRPRSRSLHRSKRDGVVLPATVRQ
jgi:hypothetical protein